MNRLWRFLKIVMLATLAHPASALTFLTEENPPLNFTKNGEITGTATVTVREILKRAGIAADFRVLPWDEAYQQAQSDPATCVYSTSRLPARYKLFQWVGPIARGQYAAFALDGFRDKINSVSDLHKYRIGVARDARGQYLRQRGFAKLVEFDKDAEIPALLTLNPAKEGGVDIWVTQAQMAHEVARSAGAGAVKEVFPSILTQEYWLACNLKMPQEQVRALSDALSLIDKESAGKPK